MIARIGAATAGTRALLCALARRGKHLQQSEPERGELLLGPLRRSPIYKGARVMFDLLELEDLMLDGELPAQVDGYFEAPAVRALVESIESLRKVLIAGSTGAQREAVRHSDVHELSALPLGTAVELGSEPAPEGGWPALNGADYLFDHVVLGVLRQLSRAAAANEAARGASVIG